MKLCEISHRQEKCNAIKRVADHKEKYGPRESQQVAILEEHKPQNVQCEGRRPKG